MSNDGGRRIGDFHMSPMDEHHELRDIWRAIDDQRNLITEVKALVIGADGNNGLRSRVGQLEQEHELRTIRLHERLDSLMTAVNDIRLTQITEDHMHQSIALAIANAFANEKRFSMAHWLGLATTVAAVGTLILQTILMKAPG